MTTPSAYLLRVAPVCLAALVVSCSSPSDQPAASSSAAPAASASAAAPEAPLPPRVSPAEEQAAPPLAASPYEALPGAVREILEKPFTGDFKEMVQHRLIRAGVVFNRTMYFIDRGEQRGMAYDALKLFEEQVNKRLKTGKLTVHVAFVPLSRDQLLPALTSGKVDVVAATLTVTPEREKLVQFSNPTRTGVSQVVVTGPKAPPLSTPDDLSGRAVYVRKGSAYYESLVALNEDLKKR